MDSAPVGQSVRETANETVNMNESGTDCVTENVKRSDCICVTQSASESGTVRQTETETETRSVSHSWTATDSELGSEKKTNDRALAVSETGHRSDTWWNVIQRRHTAGPGPPCPTLGDSG